jgi:hypothetical protein
MPGADVVGRRALEGALGEATPRLHVLLVATLTPPWPGDELEHATRPVKNRHTSADRKVDAIA